MSDKLLPYYSRELTYIRALAADFAKSHPAMAERLGVSENPDEARDPHVERLIEAFAYLTGRIRRKLDDDFPELINGLMGVLYPHYLAPIPSMAIAQIQLSRAQAELTEGYTVAVGAEVEAPVTSGTFAGEKCLYRTSYPVTVWPIEISAARLGGLTFIPGSLKAGQAVAALHITLRCLSKEVTFAKLPMRDLRFFLNGQDQHTLLLYELIFNNTVEVVLRRTPTDSDPPLLGKNAVRDVGFAKTEGLLPYPNRSFPGYRLLSEYFVFPRKFLFFDIEFPAKSLASAGGQIELILYLNRTYTDIEKIVAPDTFRLGCTPMINLFQKRADHIELDETKTEYRIVPDRRRHLAHEVYSIDQVSVTPRGERSIDCRPFYSFTHRTPVAAADMFWYSRRRSPRVGQRTDHGTEVYLSLVDLEFEAAVTAERSLTADITCLSRDLPQFLPWGGGQPRLSLTAGGPVTLECLTQPTRTFRGESDRGAMWRLISHLSLNYLSLEGGPEAADALREILRLYDYAASAESRSKIDSILDVSSRRVTGRAGGVAAGGTCRGVEVTIRFDEDRFSDRGLFLFATVLERFLALYCTINSFVQLVATTKQREDILRRWPRRTGEQVLL